VHRSFKLVDVEFLILFALGSWVDCEFSFSHRWETLRFLLQVLADRSELGIETMIENNTLWEHAVVIAYDFFSGQKSRKSLDAPFTKGGTPWLRNGPLSLDTSDTSESWRSSVHGWEARQRRHSDRQELPRRHQYAKPVVVQLAKVHGKEKAQVQVNREIAIPQTKRLQKLREEKKATLCHKSDDSLPAAEDEIHVVTPPVQYDVPFENSRTEKRSHRAGVSDIQQGVDILRCFLSITDKPRGLLNKNIVTPRQLTFKPLTILRKALAQGREKAEVWSSQPEYQFLYQLVGLQETNQSTGQY